MDILEKQISPEAKASVVISGGKLSLSAVLDTEGVGASVSVSIDTGYFFDELAKKIPGTLDDAILGMLKTAVAGL